MKCTKRLYTLFTKHLDNVSTVHAVIVMKPFRHDKIIIVINYSSQALSKCKYEYVCVLLNVLRYIAKGSLSPQNGYAKLSSFGLPNKISINLWKHSLAWRYMYLCLFSLYCQWYCIKTNGTIIFSPSHSIMAECLVFAISGL